MTESSREFAPLTSTLLLALPLISTLAPASATLPPLPQLKQKPCILYNIDLKNRKIQSSIDSESKVNAILQDLVKSLKLLIFHTYWGIAKIDGSCLTTSRMVLTTFSIEDKHGRTCWFEETFFIANVTHNIMLGMPFLKLADPNIRFAKNTLL